MLRTSDCLTCLFHCKFALFTVSCCVPLSGYFDNDVHLSFSVRSDRPLEWVPEEPSPHEHGELAEDYDLHQDADLTGNDTVDIQSIHSGDVTGNGGTPSGHCYLCFSLLFL